MTVLPDLQIAWPTRSRTGSQFVLQLTTAFRGGGLAPQSRISGARRESFRPAEKEGDFHSLFHQGLGVQYLQMNKIRSLKYEDPGKDDFILELHKGSHARFVASYRRIEKVIESHHNIKSWGHREDDVLYQFSACATLYEQLSSDGRLFLIDVDRPDRFNIGAFARFLGVANVPQKALELVRGWLPINDLKYQVEKSGIEFTGRRSPPRLERLRSIHPWVDDTERRYEALLTPLGVAGDEAVYS